MELMRYDWNFDYIYHCQLHTNQCGILDKALPRKTYILKNHKPAVRFLDRRS